MTTPPRTNLDELTETLIDRHGWLVSGDALITLLGYPSAAAFRQAVARRRVPVRVFGIAGRRGTFAWVPDIAAWLAGIGQASNSDVAQEDTMTT